jgi:ribosome-binding ATPase YchF (GTP1/OBG family)
MATVDIVDIAGLLKEQVKGRFKISFLETLESAIHVLRCFDNDNIVHVDGNVNPIRDKETIDIELQLKDLDTVNVLKR